MSIKLEKTAQEQKELYLRVQNENRSLIGDPANLACHIGEVVSLRVLFKELTEQLLAKLYVEGTEDDENAAHLIPYWQIVRFDRVIPKLGEYFVLTAVVGIRRVYDDSYVIALRLPR